MFGDDWWRKQARKRWVRIAPRYAYNFALLGFFSSLLVGVGLIRLYLAPPVSIPQLSAAIPPTPPWQMEIWQAAPAANRWQQRRRLASGENLQEMLQEQDIAPEQIESVLASLRETLNWRSLRAGQWVTIFFVANEAQSKVDVRFDGLALTLNDKRLVVQASETGWEVREQATPTPRPAEVFFAQGKIDDNFYESARSVGIAPPLIPPLLDLLDKRNLRANDLRGITLEVAYTLAPENKILYFRAASEKNDFAYWLVASANAYFDETGKRLGSVWRRLGNKYDEEFQAQRARLEAIAKR